MLYGSFPLGSDPLFLFSVGNAFGIYIQSANS